MLLDGWKTFQLIRTALASSNWSEEKIRAVQEQKVRKLINHAYLNVPLYRTLYDEEGFKPQDFRTLDDFAVVPLLKKERLKAASPNEMVAIGVDPAQCASVTTSGSTGHPFRIYLGSNEVQWQRAVAWRILLEHGYRWNDRTMEIRMAPGANFFIQKFGIAQKDWVSILDSPQSWVKLLGRKKHDVIVASASTLHALAEEIDSKGVTISRPRIVMSDSETLSPTTRQLVRRTLGVDPIDVYGLVELSNFAWQCELRQSYHISADSHIVEVDAPSNQPGKIIVSDLGMWTMPFIRYETGDFGEIDTNHCPCGRNTPLFKRIYGRAVDSVLLSDGQQLFWPFFHEVLGAYDALSQWKVIQTELRHIVVKLIIRGDNSGPLTKRIEHDLRLVLPSDTELSFDLVDTIVDEPGEKVRMVVSNIHKS